MTSYIIATIVAALTYGLLAVVFPNAFISGSFTILTALGWIIIIMVWSFILYLLKRREEKKSQEISQDKKALPKTKKNKKK